MRETLWVPVVAVLGPLIGSAVGVLLPSREGLLHRLLAFAAGTMLTLSFLELIPESLSACSPPACAAGLAVGVFGVLALHHLLPPTPPSHPGGERRTGTPYGRGHYAAQPPRRHRHGSRQRKPHHGCSSPWPSPPTMSQRASAQRPLIFTPPITAQRPFGSPFPPACPPCWATDWGGCCGGRYRPIPWAWSPPASPD